MSEPSNTSSESGTPSTPGPGWNAPRPAQLPKPTYNPVIFAAGIIFLALGILTNYPVLVAGALLFVIGLARWIGELKTDRGTEE